MDVYIVGVDENKYPYIPFVNRDNGPFTLIPCSFKKDHIPINTDTPHINTDITPHIDE